MLNYQQYGLIEQTPAGAVQQGNALLAGAGSLTAAARTAAPSFVAGSANNGRFTTGTSVTVSSTGNVTAGNLVFIAIQVQGATNPTAITASGWTTVMATTRTSASSVISAAIFCQVAASTAPLSQSVSWTTTATLGQWSVFEVSGQGPSLIDGSSVSQINASSTAPPAPSVTPAVGNVNDLLVCMIFASTTTSTSTPSSPTGMSTILNFTGSTTDLLFGSALLPLSSASATAAQNFSLSATKSTLGVSFLVQQAATTGVQQGSVLLAGVGSLAVSEQVQSPASALLAGAGSLTAQASEIQAATALFAGAGSLTVAEQLQSPVFALLAGAGSLTVDAQAQSPAVALLAGNGSLAATAIELQAAAALLAGAGSLTAAAAVQSPAAALLAGSGSLTVGTAQLLAGSALLAGVGALTVNEQLQSPASALLAGVGSLIANGQVFSPAAALLAGSGSLTAGTTQLLAASALLAGVGALTADAIKPAAQIWQGSALLVGIGGLTVAEQVQSPAAAQLAGSGSLTTAATLMAAGSALLAGSGALAVAEASQSPAVALLAGTGALAANGVVQSPAAALLAGTGSLAAVATELEAVSALLAGSGSLAVNALVLSPAAALLAGSGSLGATATEIMQASALLAGVGSLTVDVVKKGTQDGAALLAGVGSLTATATARLQVQAMLPGAGGLAVAATQISQGAARFSGLGALSVDAAVGRQAAALLAGIGSLIVNATVLTAAKTGSALLEGAGSLTVATVAVSQAQAVFAGIGALAVDATVIHAAVVQQASALLAGTGSLLADAAVVSGAFTQASAVLAGTGGLRADAFIIPPLKSPLTYLFRFVDVAAAERDLVLASYFDAGYGYTGNIISYNLLTGLPDNNWGVFIKQDLVAALLTHPNLSLLVDATGFVFVSNLGTDPRNYQFIVNAYSIYPLRILPPPPPLSPVTPPVILDAHEDHFGSYNLFGGTQGPYWTMTNAWNLGGLSPALYTQTITNYPDSYPSGTVWAWSFPVTPNAANTWGYPEVVFGTQAGGSFSAGPANAPPPLRLNAIQNLVATYNLTRTFADGDASFLIETWAQTTPKDQSSNTHEILFYAFANGFVSDFILGALSHVFDYSDGAINVYVASDPGSSAVFMMPVTAPGGATRLDMSNGLHTINFGNLLAAVVVHGLVSGTDYITGYEFGFEISRNAGGATLNKLEWTWQPGATPPVVLDAHADHFGTYNLFGGSQGPYWINQNVWNLSGLTPAQYSQTITILPDIFPNGVVFAWSYPATPNSGNVWSYPEIVFGSQQGGGFIVPPHTPPASTINAFTALAVTYTMTLNISTPDDTDVLIETWVQTVPGNQSSNVNEVAFYAYAPAGNVGQTLGFPNHFDYSDGTFNAYIGATTGFNFIAVMPVTAPGGTTPVDLSNGTHTLPILGVMQALVSHGYINGANFIAGFEFGFEVSRNSGGATVSNIAWTWQTSATRAMPAAARTADLPI